MRYIIDFDKKDELEARRQYIYNTLHVWCFISRFAETYIELQSIPTNIYDTIFIVGHNNFVSSFLKGCEITESNIVAITCKTNYNFESMIPAKKKLYISFQNKRNYSELLNGEEFGFSFNPTESEVIFYNSSPESSIHKRLSLAFKRLKG